MIFSSISISFLKIFRIISFVFDLKYLSQNSINLNMLGVFWNPQDEQISKLSLNLPLEQDLKEILSVYTSNLKQTIFLKNFQSFLGTIASFNFDTTASGTVAATQYHLSNQYYDICIRRTRGYCSLCFSPEITSTTTTNAASFGISAGSVAAIQTAASGSHCTGVTTINAIAASNVGYGDYLEIIRLQDGTGTSTAAGATATISRICGAFWDATVASDQVTHATACTYATPFKVGVHFDNDDIILAPGDIAAAQNAGENPPVAANNGIGYSGFYLAYWQNTC